MSFGFEVYSNTVPGKVLVSSRDFVLSTLDVFEVSPFSYGNKTYANAAEFELIIVQTQVEPSVVDLNSLLALNTLQFAVNNSGADKVVSWSPNIQFGLVSNVIVYVLGS